MMNKKAIFLPLIFILFTDMVFAIPTLQLYSPQGTHNPDTETWVIPGYEYDLWVIGANKKLFDVTLIAAVPTGEAGNIYIEDGDGNVLNYSNFTYGIPDPDPNDHKKFPPHGIYPTDYFTYNLGDFGCCGDVYNMVDGGGPACGEIKEYHIKVCDYTWVHYDVYGWYKDKKGHKCCFCPFSHAADQPIPEPATLFLLGTGLIGLAGIGRRTLIKF